MNDAEYEINALINNIDHELTNLKTAHIRPLGALNFFKDRLFCSLELKDSGGSYYVDFKVIVVIAKPTTVPPIVQLGWSVPAGFYKVDFMSFENTPDYSTWTYNLSLQSPGTAITSAVVELCATSSQPIESMIWEYA